jgi:hypothetical protein
MGRIILKYRYLEPENLAGEAFEILHSAGKNSKNGLLLA